mgnify:CR=1 FL=1
MEYTSNKLNGVDLPIVEHTNARFSCIINVYCPHFYYRCLDWLDTHQWFNWREHEAPRVRKFSYLSNEIEVRFTHVKKKECFN